jgi:superfamily I DNA/RNA helicase
MATSGPRSNAKLQQMVLPQYWRLDADQARAFASDDPCVVIAGPGSGKTRMAVAKIVRLVVQHGPGKVIATTFSRLAADEMKARLRAAIGPQLAGRVAIGTFHALSAQRLRAGGNRLIAERTLIDEQSSRDMIRLAAIAAGVVDRELEGVVEQVLKLKCASLDDPGTGVGGDAAAVLARYQAKLEECAALDLTDLVREAARAMRAGTLEPWPARFVLVDEAQDLDRIQIEWLAAHVDAGSILTAVADEDQSIYGFRSALGYAGLQELSKRFGATTLLMADNYRCGKDIVEAARLVIEDNSERYPKALRATREDPGTVRLRRLADEATQAEWVAADIGAHAESMTTAAVIARTHLELDLVEAALLSLDLDVRRVGAAGVLQREHVRRFLSMLSLVHAPNNEARFLSALQALPLRRDSLSIAAEHVRVREPTEAPLDAIYDRALFERLPRQEGTLLRLWRDDFARFVNDVLGAGGDAAIGVAIKEGAARLLTHYTNVTHRRDCEFIARTLARRAGPLSSRLEAMERPRKKTGDGPTVSLLTAHASKGCEYDGVWIVNCNEGRFPNADADIEEERRLFYVAMTRARQQLTLCFSGAEPTCRFVETLRSKAAQAAQARPEEQGSEPRSAPATAGDPVPSSAPTQREPGGSPSPLLHRGQVRTRPAKTLTDPIKHVHHPRPMLKSGDRGQSADASV